MVSARPAIQLLYEPGHLQDVTRLLCVVRRYRVTRYLASPALGSCRLAIFFLPWELGGSARAFPPRCEGLCGGLAVIGHLLDPFAGGDAYGADGDADRACWAIFAFGSGRHGMKYVAIRWCALCLALRTMGRTEG